MNPSDSRLAVVIAARIEGQHNNDLLRRCLLSVLSARKESQKSWHEIQIIVIDDRSPNPISLENLGDANDKLSVLQNRGRPGQAGALNFAMGETDADVFAFTDSDCIIAADWFRCLAQAYLRWPACIGVAGPNWLHSPGGNRWTAWLTENESRLARHTFMRYVDSCGSTLRIDCRNLSLRADRISEICGRTTFFADNAGPSVSGVTSHHLRKILKERSTVIRFEAELKVWHAPVRSFTGQFRRYFMWGEAGAYSSLYRDEHRSLMNSFLVKYFRRHFISPCYLGGASPLYVVTVHAGYWLGIMLNALGDAKLKQ